MADPDPDETMEARLRQLASQPKAIVRRAALPKIWGLDEAAADALLAKLADIKLVDVWDKDRLLVLSDKAMEWLNLVAIPDRHGRLVLFDRGTYRAERAKQEADMFTGRSTKPRRKGLKTILESDLQCDAGSVSLDELPGPSSIDLEDAGHPTLLLGLGLAWKRDMGRGPCKGCSRYQGKKKLPTSAYCCLCERSGNPRVRAVLPEGVLPPVDTPAKVKQGENRKKAPARSTPLAGGVGSRPKGQKQARKKTMKIA